MKALPHRIEPGYHGVQFYSDEEFLFGVVAAFLADGLQQGQPVMVIATSEHREAISGALRARGIDVEARLAQGTMVMLDADEMLARFMIDGMLDAARCKTVLGARLRTLSGGHRTCVVRAFGEMVDVLWRAGNPDAAIRLEVLWNELAMTHSVALLCGYSQEHVGAPLSVRNVSAQHTHVLPRRAPVS